MKTPSILQFSISKRPEWTQNYVQEPFKKHPRAELGHWYFYYQYQNDQSEFGGGMDAIAQQQGELFPEAYLQRLGQCIRKLNKFMRPKPKSKYSSSTPKKHKKHYVKRGSTVPFIIRLMFVFFIISSNTIKMQPLWENDTSKTDCLIPGVRGADGPFSPVVSTMLPSVWTTMRVAFSVFKLSPIWRAVLPDYGGNTRVLNHRVKIPMYFSIPTNLLKVTLRH